MPDYVIFLPYIYCEEPTQIVAQQAAMMLRFLKMRAGIVAVLGTNIWTATKATSNAPIRLNSAMIRQSLHWRLSIHQKVQMMVRATHSIRLATPLKCQQKTDHTRYQDCSAKGIKLRQLLHPGKLGCISVGDLKTEGDYGYRHGTEGQIDIKGPPPRYL